MCDACEIILYFLFVSLPMARAWKKLLAPGDSVPKLLFVFLCFFCLMKCVNYYTNRSVDMLQLTGLYLIFEFKNNTLLHKSLLQRCQKLSEHNLDWNDQSDMVLIWRPLTISCYDMLCCKAHSKILCAIPFLCLPAFKGNDVEWSFPCLRIECRSSQS